MQWYYISKLVAKLGLLRASWQKYLISNKMGHKCWPLSELTSGQSVAWSFQFVYHPAAFAESHWETGKSPIWQNTYLCSKKHANSQIDHFESPACSSFATDMYMATVILRTHTKQNAYVHCIWTSMCRLRISLWVMLFGSSMQWIFLAFNE